MEIKKVFLLGYLTLKKRIRSLNSIRPMKTIKIFKEKSFNFSFKINLIKVLKIKQFSENLVNLVEIQVLVHQEKVML